MGYRKGLMSKIVKGIDRKIVVNDSKYIFENKLELIFEETMDMTNYYDFTIKDLNGVDYYKCGYYQGNIVVYSVCGKPICHLVNLSPYKSKQSICKGKKDKNLIALIKEKDSTSAEKFSIEFINLINHKTELLDLNCDSNYRCGGVFYGKEKYESPLIFRIIRNLYYANYYKIEIAPGIDVPFMIAIACFFMRRSYRENKGQYPEVTYRNFFDGVNQKQVERPLKNIITTTDYNNYFEIPVLFNLVKNKKFFTGCICKITGMDKTYGVKEELDENVLYDAITNESIIRISDGPSDIKKIFWIKDRRVGSITSINSRYLNKYLVEIFNKETKKMENFVMNCDPHFYYGFILYHNKNGQVSLVCKITKDQYEKYDYQIEIAPGVDYMMMIAACLYFVSESNELIEYGIGNGKTNSKNLDPGRIVNTISLINKFIFKK